MNLANLSLMITDQDNSSSMRKDLNTVSFLNNVGIVGVVFDNNMTSWNTTSNHTVVSLVDIPIVRATLIILYSLVFLLCFFGNLILLVVVAGHPAMRTATNFFLANLAAADLLVAVFCVIQRIIHQHMFYHGHWPLGDFFCRLYIFLLQMVPSTSAGLLLVLSVERFIALLRPMLARSLLTKGRLAIVAGLTWLASTGANIPFFFSSKVYTYGDIQFCTRDSTVLNLPVLFLINFLLWYVAPLCIMIIIYTRIGAVLWQSSSEGAIAKSSVTRISMKVLSPAKDENNSLPKSKSNGKQNDGQHKRLLNVSSSEIPGNAPPKERVDGRRRVIRLLIAIIVSFALLCLPHHVRQLWSNWTPGYAHDIYGIKALFPDLAFLLLFMNSAVNPLLYALMSKKFRKAIKDVFGRKHIRDKKREQFVSSMRSTLTVATDNYSTTECGPT